MFHVSFLFSLGLFAKRGDDGSFAPLRLNLPLHVRVLFLMRAPGRPRAAPRPRGREQSLRAFRDFSSAPRSTTAGARSTIAAVQDAVTHEKPKTLITRNDSPDISFDRSINPYRGCEHGCVYCFARPTHAYLGLSPGLDFESRLIVKDDAAQTAAARIVRAPITSRKSSRSEPIPIPTSRSSASMASCARSWKFWPRPIIRSPSSPNRRWSCAISTSGADGGQGPGQGRAVGDDARPRTGAGDGAARLDAAAPA